MTKSFYLSSDVVRVLEQWPLRERSKAVDRVLRKYLKPPGSAPEHSQIDEAKVRALIQEELAGLQIAAPPEMVEEEKKASALDALAAILGMREGSESEHF